MENKTYTQIIEYLEQRGYDKTKPGLSRTLKLLEKCGNPHNKLKFIHVAGTNGKGSISVMLSFILVQSGLSVGFYPSPYLVNFNERIQVNNIPIDNISLERIANYVISKADEMEDHPTYFEMVTVIGMLYFVEKKCDIVILEVGLGGRLDSTNIIQNPIMCIIANIGYDHQNFLGNTIEEIAYEKAGIIKNNSVVVSYDNLDSVREILNKVAKEQNAKIYYPESNSVKLYSYSLSQNMQTVSYNNKLYTVSLLGLNQLKNLEVVFKAIELLNKMGYSISEQDVIIGLEKVCWHARFEVLRFNPTIILDGGHNEQCAISLVDNIGEYIDKKVVFVLGILKDKNYSKVIDILLPYANKIICVTPPNIRALDANSLKKEVVNRINYFEQYGLTDTYGGDILTTDDVSTETSISNIFNQNNSGDIVVCFGSLYLAGKILKLLDNN